MFVNKPSPMEPFFNYNPFMGGTDPELYHYYSEREKEEIAGKKAETSTEKTAEKGLEQLSQTALTLNSAGLDQKVQEATKDILTQETPKIRAKEPKRKKTELEELKVSYTESNTWKVIENMGPRSSFTKALSILQEKEGEQSEDLSTKKTRKKKLKPRVEIKKTKNAQTRKIQASWSCVVCGSTNTPQWRKRYVNGGNVEIICNACGLKEKRKKQK